MRILYVSPLKALNQDVWHNLQFPLGGILARSEEIGSPLPALRVAVRSGDTPAHERAAIVRKPPGHPDHHARIAAPDAHKPGQGDPPRDLPRDHRRDSRGLRQQARGFPGPLARAAAGDRQHGRFIRIGLSATQRPLDEVARYLGGIEWAGESPSQRRAAAAAGHDRRCRLAARPRFASDLAAEARTRRRRRLDLARDRRGAVCRSCGEHRSTIIFANNRRTVEKLTSRLNELAERRGPRATCRDARRSRGRAASATEVSGRCDGRFGPVPGPPWKHQPRRAASHRRGAQAGRALGGRGDRVARAGDRHGGGRPGLPGRVAGKRGQGPAAGRSGGARGARREQGPADRQDPGRPARIGRALSLDAARAKSSTCASRWAASTSWPSK